MITKAFVTLLSVTNIDDIFSQFLPVDILENADELNDSDKMYIGVDNNTLKKICGRIFNSLKGEELTDNLDIAYNLDDPVQKSVYFKNKFRSERKLRRRVNVCWQILYAFLDILVNIWYYLLFNLHILVYNYFGGLIVIFIQAIGLYLQYYGHIKLDNPITGVVSELDNNK